MGSVPPEAADPVLVASPTGQGDVPRHFAMASLHLRHGCWLLTSGLVLLGRTERGLVWFLQEGAHPGSPRTPGAGAHQESSNFSARLPCAGEPQQRGGQHTLC